MTPSLDSSGTPSCPQHVSSSFWVDTAEIRFRLEQELFPHETPKVRGAIASSYPDLILLHNHTGKELRYASPLVQYKVIGGEIIMIGLGEGADTLRKVCFDMDVFQIGGRKSQIMERQVRVRKQRFGAADAGVQYCFRSPWLALNNRNYFEYLRIPDVRARKELLSRILIGNLISISKSLGYTVPKGRSVAGLELEERQCNLKSVPMLGFSGTFSVNFEIPDYWGIGKSVSRGFGTVVRMEGR